MTAFAQDSTRSLVWVEGQPHFNELLLVPIVTTGHVALADDPQIWQAVQDPLVQQLVRMFPKDWSMGFFKGVVPVEDLLGMPWQTGWSDCQVDGQRLSQDIARAVESLNQDGYEVVSISPVTSGVYFYQYNDQDITSAPRILMETEKVSGGGSYGFGYGFSYTEGVTVIAKRVA